MTTSVPPTSGKKVGVKLNDESARIDTQNPPKKDTFNVQYQIGEDSVACVIFTAYDDRGEVLQQLRESLNKNKKATSPNV